MKFYIDGQEWELKVDQKLPNKDVGVTFPVSKTIKISRIKDRDTFNEVLSHELVHAMISRTGLSGLMSEEQEEAACDALGIQFYRFIEDNKEILWKIFR